MEKNGKNRIKLTDKVTKENINSPQFHKWVARILAVCFILMLAVQFIGCMSFSTYASETDTITLESGTYRFNDVLTELYPLYQSINFSTTFDGETTDYVGIDLSLYEDAYFCLALKLEASTERVYFNPVPSGYETFYPYGWIGGIVFEITIPVDTEVADTFGSWFIANTNYNEVNATTKTVNIYGGDNYDQIQWSIEYEDGMTWGEWYNSEYNYDVNTNSRIFNYGTLYTNMTEYTDVYYTSGYIIEGVQYYRVLMTEYSNEYGNTPHADDLIQDFTDGNFYLLYQIASVSKDYHDGYEEGRDVGYNNGYNDGYNTGYEEGETNGYNEGRTDGYNSGYNDGASANFGENIIGGTFNGVLGALNSIIIYQTPNGTPVTIMGIVWGVIGIAVFIWVLKLFVGG